MENKYYDIILKFLILSIILIIGASIGALFADNNNNNDILKVVNNEIKPSYLALSVDGEIRYFIISEVQNPKTHNYNIDLINKTEV